MSITIPLKCFFIHINQIIYSNMSAAPTTSYRSPGVKLLLYAGLSAYQLDYSIGIEPYN